MRGKDITYKIYIRLRNDNGINQFVFLLYKRVNGLFLLISCHFATLITRKNIHVVQLCVIVINTFNVKTIRLKEKKKIRLN